MTKSAANDNIKHLPPQMKRSEVDMDCPGVDERSGVDMSGVDAFFADFVLLPLVFPPLVFPALASAIVGDLVSRLIESELGAMVGDAVLDCFPDLASAIVGDLVSRLIESEVGAMVCDAVLDCFPPLVVLAALEVVPLREREERPDAFIFLNKERE